MTIKKYDNKKQLMNLSMARHISRYIRDTAEDLGLTPSTFLTTLVNKHRDEYQIPPGDTNV